MAPAPKETISLDISTESVELYYLGLDEEGQFTLIGHIDTEECKDQCHSVYTLSKEGQKISERTVETPYEFAYKEMLHWGVYEEEDEHSDFGRFMSGLAGSIDEQWNYMAVCKDTAKAKITAYMTCDWQYERSSSLFTNEVSVERRGGAYAGLLVITESDTVNTADYLRINPKTEGFWTLNLRHSKFARVRPAMLPDGNVAVFYPGYSKVCYRYYFMNDEYFTDGKIAIDGAEPLDAFINNEDNTLYVLAERNNEYVVYQYSVPEDLPGYNTLEQQAMSSK
ncbi:MAG: hypothetical protein CL946_00970 [Ectothiorhodospiraceae bacterium]|nr:hypothetical protein [Ectothiorhodospiraceae bacterium]